MELIKLKDIEFTTCTAIGRFDGVHLGHRAVIEKCIETAKTRGISSLVVLVDDTEDLERYLNDIPERRYLISQINPDYLAIVDGRGRDLDFIYDDVVEKTSTECLVCGDEPLSTTKLDVEVLSIDSMVYEGNLIDSKMCERYLQSGDMEVAKFLLGRDPLILGKVIHGKGMGRSVGMPTANLLFSDKKILPKRGVYVSKSHVLEGAFVGLTSIGRRPSIDQDENVTIETYMLDFDEEIYGEIVALDILEYIRGIEKFAGLKEVKKQIDKDMEVAKRYALHR